MRRTTATIPLGCMLVMIVIAYAAGELLYVICKAIW